MPVPTSPFQGLLLALWSDGVVAPFFQSDWPLPQAPYYGNDLRTWTLNVPLPLYASLPVGQQISGLANPEFAAAPYHLNRKIWYTQQQVQILPPGSQFFDLAPSQKPFRPDVSYIWSFQPPVSVKPVGSQLSDLARPDYAAPFYALNRFIWYNQQQVPVVQPVGQQLYDRPSPGFQPDRGFAYTLLPLITPPPPAVVILHQFIHDNRGIQPALGFTYS